MASAKRLYIPVVILVLALAAAPRAEARSWHLTAEAATDFPVSLGGRLLLEMPGRIRLSTALGYLPQAYVDAVDAIVVHAGGHDEAQGDLIRSAIGSSLVWRTHLGWRPFPRHGFYFEVGYGLVALGGNGSSEALIAMATGQPPPAGEVVRDYSVRTMMHMIDAEMGWEWQVLRRHLSFRLALGFTATLTASSRIKTSFRPLNPAAVDLFTRMAEIYLDRTLETYVMTPVVTFGIGYRFF